MLFCRNIIDKMASKQGEKFRSKCREGFTQAFPNASLDEIKKNDQKFLEISDDVNRKMANLARSQQTVQKETKDFLTVASRDSKYLNNNVYTTDGTYGYVTGEGIFKPYNSKDDALASMGKNGCPSSVLGLDTGANLYTDDGEYLAGPVPMKVGTPMVKGQQCGMAGENVYVGRSNKGVGESKFLGCKRGDSSLVATGVKADLKTPQCPAGTFQCGKTRGYCYDPRRNAMVSTYRVPQYDAPVGASSGNVPFLADDGVTYLWFRQGGFDSKCGTKPDVPPCPAGTSACTFWNTYGYCWDPAHNAMVSTRDPNVKTVGRSVPYIMHLVKGNFFNYDRKTRFKYVSDQYKDRNSVPINMLQRWQPDKQFISQSNNPQNKVYLQFKAAAESTMPYLKDGRSTNMDVISAPNTISFTMQGSGAKVAGYVYINGRKYFGNLLLKNVIASNGAVVPFLKIEARGNTLFVVAPKMGWWGGSYSYGFNESPSKIFGDKTDDNAFTSNGALFTVTKLSDKSARGVLKYGSKTLEATYNFDTAYPAYQHGFLAQDGTTRLWKKSNGYDSSCGAQPDVPPARAASELLEKCESIAMGAGYPIFGIQDNECFIGKSADTLRKADGCKALQGTNVGENGNIAAYEATGANRDGLFQYGFVTADQTLKQYPPDMMKPNGKYNQLGQMEILKAPTSEIVSNVGGEAQCKTACIGKFADNCEAFKYNGATKQCTAYGKDALTEGIMIPSTQQGSLMVQQKSFANDESCPKTFRNIDSETWNKMPKAGWMNENTKCDLGFVTNDAVMDRQTKLTELGTALDKMEKTVTAEVNSEKKLRPRLKTDNKELKKDVAEYKRLYEGLTSIKQSLKESQSVAGGASEFEAEHSGPHLEGSLTDYLIMGGAALLAGASLLRK
jgi:hypothetical protein